VVLIAPSSAKWCLPAQNGRKTGANQRKTGANQRKTGAKEGVSIATSGAFVVKNSEKQGSLRAIRNPQSAIVGWCFDSAAMCLAAPNERVTCLARVLAV
jgi:hypothetical protein